MRDALRYKKSRSAVACVFVLLLFLSQLAAQSKRAAVNPLVGDTPTDAGPLAHDLSPRLKRGDVRRVLEKVADWQQAKASPGFDQDWTFAALYAGFMAVPDAAGGKKYRDAMLQMAEGFHAQPGPRIEHADDAAIGQTYLDLYQATHDPTLLAPIRERMDTVMRIPDDPAKPLWWWCDALFMAPPVLAKLSKATGDPAYMDFMDREWWITSDMLYSQKDRLYFRDKSFLNAHQANGQSVFWARGNGWVFAGLARVLAEMPRDYPTRPRYVALFKQMAEEIASLQMEDGLWRAGLLDESAYRYPEVSGSAFFTYGFAYGINAGLLDRRRYKPAVQRAWKGLLTHVFADGRLGSIQPIGAAPGDFTPTSSYVYGTGAFLLAGSEVYRLAR